MTGRIRTPVSDLRQCAAGPSDDGPGSLDRAADAGGRLVRVQDAFYRLLEESDAGLDATTARVRSTVHTTGPWAAGLQHAGPPSALLTRAVRRLGGLPPDALPARLGFDILAPVPVADLVLTARTLRPGRRVALAEATLAAADAPERPVMTLRAWLLRQAKPPMAGLPETPTTPAPSWPHDLAPMARPEGWHPGYLDAVRWLWVQGSFEAPGPAAVWTTLAVDLVEGEDPDPVERLVAVADSASGISAVASPARMLFVNTDLTLHLTRAPIGKDIWMHAQTTLDAVGIGRTTGELGDHRGSVGHSAQCLFVEPRT